MAQAIKWMGSSKNSILVLYIFFFSFHFIAALFLANERTFLDATYYLFHLIQNKGFVIEHQRFVLVLSQLLPLVGLLLGFKLKTIIILYSINQVLFPLVLWVILFFVIKDYYSSLAMLLMQVCGVYFLFYCPMYEIWFGCYLLIFWNSLLINHWQLNRLKAILFYVLLITILFAHPLLFIGVLYVLILHYLNGHRFKITQLVLILLCFAGWFIIKKVLLTDYEGGKLSYQLNLEDNKAYLQLFSVEYLLQLIKFLLNNYGELFVLHLITAIFLLRCKAYLKLIVCIGFLSGFILLINISHANAIIHTNYFERMYLLLVPLTLMPFFCYVMPSMSLGPTRWVLLFTLIVLSYRGVNVISHHSWYSDRISKIDELLKKAQSLGISKVALKEDAENFDLFEWSLPMESILFSSTLNKKSVTISNANEIADLIQSRGIGKDEFRLRFDIIMKDKELNPDYFLLSSGHYKSLP